MDLSKPLNTYSPNPMSPIHPQIATGFENAKRALGSLATCLAVIACGTNPPNEPTAKQTASVHHGTPVSNPSVVALVERRERCDESTSSLLCSAVLVTDRVLLTAAHCAQGLVRGSLEARFAEEQTSDPSSYRAITMSAVHPAYDRSLDDNDIALLWLDAPAPAFAKPAILADLGALDVSSAATLVVGFGETDADAGTGSEMAGNVVIQSVNANTLSYVAAPAMTCRGDSGGPVFVDRDGELALAGITTSGDYACENSGIAVRVDTHRATFIDPALRNPIPVPTVATEDACFAACVTDKDCPFDLLCRTDDSGDSHCEVPNRALSSLAGSCTRDADCSSGRCAAVGSECRCTTPCSIAPNDARQQPDSPGCSFAPVVGGRGYLACAALLLLSHGFRRADTAKRRLRASARQ